MSVIKNSSWNIVAIVIPTIVALPVLGLMSRLLGIELFGIFTLFFAFLGYASIFDLGLSRALVRCISINRNDIIEVKEYIFTASFFIFFMGTIIGCLIWEFNSNIVSLLNVSEHLKINVSKALEYVAISVPILMLNIVWQSYLEGLERFKDLSIIKICTNIILSTLPLVFLWINNSIEWSILGLVIARFCSLCIFFTYSIRELVSFKVKVIFSVEKFKELIRFGSWLTVSNIISPLMAYSDKFILSSSVGASNVALYTAPSEIISKMLMIPSAIGRALFPKLSNQMNERVVSLTTIGIFIISIISILPIFYFASDILTLWLGQGYDDAALTLRILLIGYLFNSLAQVPYISIQAKGHSNITAILHIVEVIPYFIILFILIKQYSFNGAAIAWSLRVCIDYILLTIIHRKLTKKNRLHDQRIL